MCRGPLRRWNVRELGDPISAPTADNANGALGNGYLYYSNGYDNVLIVIEARYDRN